MSEPNEMIIQVARAICDRERGLGGWDELIKAGIKRPSQTEIRLYIEAKCAIRAIRKPTTAVVDAGKRIAVNMSSEDMATAFSAMIDEELR